MMSSQLAITVQPRSLAIVSRRERSMVRTSPTRSSWSRLRFSSTTTSGWAAAATAGKYPSSTSSTAYGASGCLLSAVTCPSGMLAPLWLVATSPSAVTARLSIIVLVVLPLVPVTRATRLPVVRRRSACGSSFNATRPPIMPPAPSPIFWDSFELMLPKRTAAAVRKGRRAGEAGSSLPLLGKRLPAFGTGAPLVTAASLAGRPATSARSRPDHAARGSARPC